MNLYTNPGKANSTLIHLTGWSWTLIMCFGHNKGLCYSIEWDGGSNEITIITKSLSWPYMLTWLVQDQACRSSLKENFFNNFMWWHKNAQSFICNYWTFPTIRTDVCTQRSSCCSQADFAFPLRHVPLTIRVIFQRRCHGTKVTFCFYCFLTTF